MMSFADSRRAFLYQLSVALSGLMRSRAGSFVTPRLWEQLVASADPLDTNTIEVIRPQDLLVLRFEFSNVQVLRKSRLLRRRSRAETRMIVRLPPQHVAEETFGPETKDNVPVTPTSARGMFAEPWASRLVFKWKPHVAELPLDMATLLDWNNSAIFEPELRSAVTAPGTRRPHPFETALELPFRLWMSPVSSTQANERSPLWLVSKPEPKAIGKSRERITIWHAALATATAQPGENLRRLNRRAVRPGAELIALWSPDLVSEGDPGQALPAFETPLTAADRNAIGVMAADRQADHRPVIAESMLLSSLGSWAQMQGKWDPPLGTGSTSLDSWRNVTRMGRDEFVRVTHRAEIFCFGHRVLIVEETVRRIQSPGDSAGYVAALRKHFYVLRVDRVRHYDPSNFNYGGRELPFTSIELLTIRTPNLADQSLSDIAGKGRQAFWPSVEDVATAACTDPLNRKLSTPDATGQHPAFCFQFLATDKQGRQVPFSTPVIVIDSALTWGLNGVDPAADPQWIANLAKADWDRWSNPHPISFSRARIALAEPVVAASGSEQEKASTIAFDVERIRVVAQLHEKVTPAQAAQPADLSKSGWLRFLPEMDFARIIPPDSAASEDEEITSDVRYYCKYLGPNACLPGTQDPASNPGDVFLEHSFTNGNTTVDVKFGGDVNKATGFTMPNFTLAGFSRTYGAVGGQVDVGHLKIDGLDEFANNTFDAVKFFIGGVGEEAAKLFGAIPLASLFKTNLPAASAPQLKRVTLPTLPQVIEKRFDWEAGPAELARPSDLINFGVVTGPATRLELHALIRTTIPSDQPPEHSLTCTIDNIGIAFIPGLELLGVNFKKVEFTKRSGDKARVNVELGTITGPNGKSFPPIQFKGAAAFIDDLQKALPLPGFGKGLRINVDEQGLVAGFDVQLPDMAVGAFSLRNIRPNLELHLPFTNIPTSICVGFASRAQPFCVTVGLFGGGGFVQLCAYTSPDKVRTPVLEGAIEFGGAFFFSLAGIASGGVYVMAGVYFSIADSVTLEGYLRAGGEVRLFAIATVGLEVYLGIRYISAGGFLYGSARLTLSIEILFFSAEVTVAYEQRFAGSGSDQFALSSSAIKAPLASMPKVHPGCDSPENPSGDLSFQDRMPADAWRRYWAAFDLSGLSQHPEGAI
jgi:hypothetical protein